ncbi:hypothetical protein [Microbacterium deminutum]|uniref:Lipoprotein n=1 Tax=Microbacterium deminutum TaxID=344164 RepID=A0ABN2QHQ9_9MICO
MSRLRRIAAGGVVIALVATLAACISNGQSVRRSTGSSDGTTLHLSLADDFRAMMGGKVLGGAEAGEDRLDGDLIQVKPGMWRGTVTGRTQRDILVTVMDQKCETSVKGSQKIDVVARSGKYAEGRNLRLALTPVKPPTYSTYPTCNQPVVKEKASNGIEFLWFYFDAYRGKAMDVHLPPPPGGTWNWDYAPNPNPGYPSGCGDLIARCEHSTTLKVEYR